MKTVVLLGDLHAAHLAGLTPPGWMVRAERFPQVNQMQNEMWKYYKGWVKKYKKPDLLICNGDACDGKGNKSGGNELITSDLHEQADIAVSALEMWDAEKIVMTTGTRYHTATGSGEDVEQIIADKLGAQIFDHAFVRMEGLLLDIKHFIGSSSIPWGRHSAVARDRVQNLLWQEQDGQPKSDIFVRSHCHYHQYAGGPGWLSMTLPALQAPATRFGAMICSGTVDFGIVVMTLDNGKILEWHPEIIRLKSCFPEVVTV